MSKSREGWNPYLLGGLSGLLMVWSLYYTGKFFGASTSFVRAAALVEGKVIPERAAALEYLVKNAAKIDWQMMFVIGILVGAFISSVLFGEFKLKAVPDMWQRHFGDSAVSRGLVAFLGGAVAMFGARLADGCPSGHGLSGTSQLAVSGFIALICFFVAGAIVARMIYGGGQNGS